MSTVGFKSESAFLGGKEKQKLTRKQPKATGGQKCWSTSPFPCGDDKSIGRIEQIPSRRDLLGGRPIQPITNEHGGKHGS